MLCDKRSNIEKTFKRKKLLKNPLAPVIILMSLMSLVVHVF